MKRFAFAAVFFAFSTIIAAGLTSSASTVGYASAGDNAKPDGKAVFLKYKCDNCHAVSTADIVPKLKTTTAPDLVNVTVRHQKDWIRKFIHQEVGHSPCPKVDSSLDGKLHLGGKFKGDQDEEDALIEWLDQQKKKE